MKTKGRRQSKNVEGIHAGPEIKNGISSTYKLPVHPAKPETKEFKEYQQRAGTKIAPGLNYSVGTYSGRQKKKKLPSSSGNVYKGKQ